MPVRALGVDVGVRKGLDLVLIDDAGAVLETQRRATMEDLAEAIARQRPDAVAIDSPPGWALTGGIRSSERELARFGIHAYGTPAEDREGDKPFYEWMRVGFRAFAVAAEAGFPRFRNGPADRTALEVYPHATAVVLAGCLPAAGTRKRRWREGILARQGVDVSRLRSMDQIDAALAALTGVRAVMGRKTALGDPAEGVIVLPVTSLPARPFRRCAEPRPAEAQAHLPGMTPCACGDPGCTALTRGEFARGHDAKRKSLLWAKARLGDEAARELTRRGWELPPELR